MSVTAASGVFAYALQNVKSDEAGYVAPTSFVRHYSADIDYGPVQEMVPVPPEIGNVPMTTGMYKRGVSMNGGATLNMRLQGDAGLLLRATFGNVTTTPGTAQASAVRTAWAFNASSPITTGFTQPPSPRRLLFTGSGITGGNITITAIAGTDRNGNSQTDNTPIVLTGSGTGLSTRTFRTVTSISFTSSATAGTVSVGYYQTASHLFAFASNAEFLPWLTVQKIVPGTTRFSERGIDNRVTAARFVLPAGGLLQARFDFRGIFPAWQEGTDLNNPTTGHEAQITGSYEDYTSIPVMSDGEGYVRLPNYSAQNMKFVNATINFGNNLTEDDQERIIGTPYLDNLVVLQRAITIQGTWKWNDAALYQRFLVGNNSLAAGWSTVPFETDLQIRVIAPTTIPGTTSTRYSLQFDAPNVIWNVQGPPQLQAGGTIMLPVVGTVRVPTTGSPFTATLVNEVQGY